MVDRSEILAALDRIALPGGETLHFDAMRPWGLPPDAIVARSANRLSCLSNNRRLAIRYCSAP